MLFKRGIKIYHYENEIKFISDEVTLKLYNSKIPKVKYQKKDELILYLQYFVSIVRFKIVC